MTRILFVRISRGYDIKCSFKTAGEFLIVAPFSVESSSERDLMLRGMDKFLNQYFSVSYAEPAPDGFFYRFTNDKNEFEKIQNLEYTQSVNHTDNRLEHGISVSGDMSYCALGAYEYFYKVSGKVIGRGSDGEPILDAGTMKKHSPYKSIACYCKKQNKKQAEKEQEFLQEYGWTANQLHDLKFETLCHKCKIQYINEDGEIADFSVWGSNPQKIFDKWECDDL